MAAPPPTPGPRSVVPVLAVLLAFSAAAASGQPAARAVSPPVWVAPSFAPSTTAAYSFADSDRRTLRYAMSPSALSQQGARPSDSSRMFVGALLAGAGSLAGLYSGAIVGVYVAAAMGATDGFSGLGAGAVIGLWLGAAVGSTAAGGKFGPSLVGSAAGMLLGSGLMTVMGEDNGVAPAAFVLTHAFTTASFGF